MIKGITAGRGLVISGGTTPQTYFNTSNSTLCVGSVRWNPSGQNLETYDGHTWHVLQSGYSNIELSPEIHELLDWARVERQRQKEYAELAKKHPAVADAMESVKDAELKLRELAILCKE